ncbi:MAG: AAA family ATPase [Hydrogenobacter thermophilus]|uniref:DNA repair protein RecN n=1 Tax=Hydrogenobacter thermophilus TaxID=940 RepID=UPI001C793330|nr:AAA family ATPase [Hydrogenobacter thermophilus]QWK19644.1 MAG: AAA family ATPase [Hydrogenobacter thermophilus]
MLVRIYLEDFFIIKHQEVEFGEGLNVLTGESGAGKSLTVSSLLFLMGHQQDYPEGTAVEAEFLKDGEQILVRREIKKGKSRYYLNGVGSIQKVVKEIVSSMVLLQGQNDRMKILRRDFQRDLYDRFAGVLDLRREYEKLYARLVHLKEKLRDWNERQRERKIRLAVILEELRDIERVGLSHQEYEDIKEKLSTIEHMEKINALVGRALDHLDTQGGLIDRMLDLKRALSELCRYDKTVEPFVKGMENISDELKYLRQFLSSKLLDLDPEEINRLNEKVYQVQKLERRYGMKYKDILAYAGKLRSQIEDYQKEEDSKEELEKGIEELECVLKSLADKLSDGRRSAKETFEERVMETLRDMGLERSSFKVSFSQEEGRYGRERVEFLFSSYGKDEKPLESVVSGGEISRIALSFFLLSPASETYVLDEIDAGIGGETSLRLAKLLRRLSESMQVIVITHSPAIASAAHKHILVKKEFKDDSAFVKIEELSDEERLEEIARLMGVVSEKTIEGAKDLVKETSNV